MTIRSAPDTLTSSIDAPAGSDSAANSETTAGSIVYDASDGLGAITINGTAITAVGQVIATPLGQLTITSLTPGEVGYSYTLADNSDANGNPTDIFTVIVTDRDADDRRQRRRPDRARR